MFEAAQQLAHLNISVIPIQRGSKRPASAWGEFATRRSDQSERYAWFVEQSHQLAVVTGSVSDELVILDFDSDTGYESFAAEHPVIRSLPRIRTGSGKHHVWFRTPAPVRASVERSPDGGRVEVRAGKHYTLVPPSIHPDTGQAYVWEIEPFDGIPVVELATLGITQRPRSDAPAHEPLQPERALDERDIHLIVELVTPYYVPYSRHDLCLALAGWLAGRGVREDDAIDVVRQLARHAGDEGRLTEYRRGISDSYRKIRQGEPVAGWARLTDRSDPLVSPSVAKRLDLLISDHDPHLVRTAPSDGDDADTCEQRSFPFSDLGNAERLVTRVGRDLRYCALWTHWLHWNGRYWEMDESETVVRLAKETVRTIYADAAVSNDAVERRKIAKFALGSESAPRIRAMLELARSESAIPLQPDDFDRDPWLLTVANGTVDLHTGALLPHQREHLITRGLDVAYDPEALCPTFTHFLQRILGGDPEVVAFVQRAIGYSLTGSTEEQCLFIAWGTGSNGKSTLLDLLLDLLGAYARQTPTDTLMARRNDAIPNDIARLQGARFVASTETDEGKRLSEPLIKQLTGGDRIAARFMRAEWFEFKPTFKLWLATNHKPIIRGTDHAIWRRIRLIPFTVTIPESEQDRRLPARLRAELPGILRWAIDGCLAWQRDGLTPPASIIAATDSYRVEMDLLALWIEDCCTVGDTLTDTATALYRSYVNWCENNGQKPLAQRSFGLRLAERGMQSDRTMYGRFWVGIQVRSGPPNGAAP